MPKYPNFQNHPTTACIQRALLLNPKDTLARRLASEVMQRMAQGRTYPLLPSYIDTGRRPPPSANDGREKDEEEAVRGWGQEQGLPQEQQQEGVWEEEEEQEEEEQGDDRPDEERYLTWYVRSFLPLVGRFVLPRACSPMNN